MRASCLVLLTLAGILPAQTVTIQVTNGAAGRIVRPGASESLSFLVRQGSNPLPGTEVSLSAPSDGPSGLFPAAAGSRNLITVKTNSAGIATANFVVNDSPGWFRVDAAVPYITALPASVSFSTFSSPPATPTDPLTARAQLLRADPGLNSPTAVLHGPWLLPAGVSVREHIGISRGLPIFPAVLSWFFWLDIEPGANFNHRSLFVTLPANAPVDAAIPQSRGWTAQWWPVIDSGPAAFPLNNAALPLLRPLPRSATILRAADADACAILFAGAGNKSGAYANALYTISTWEQTLLSTGAVDADHLFIKRDENGDLQPASPEWLKDAVKKAKESGCKKIYIIGHAHGDKPATAGGSASIQLIRESGAGPAKLTYTELRDILLPLKGATVDILLMACYSGQFSATLKDAGLSGVVVTDADSSHVSENIKGTGSAFGLAAASKLLLNDKLTVEDSWLQTQSKPVEAIQELKKEGLPTPDGGRYRPVDLGNLPDTAIQGSGPSFNKLTEISPNANVFFPDVYLPRPGASGIYTVALNPATPLPFTFNLSGFSTNIVAIPEQLAQRTLNDVLIPVRQPFPGIGAGDTRFTLTGKDGAGNSVTATANIRVGSFNLSTRSIVMSVGDSTEITGTPLAPFGLPALGNVAYLPTLSELQQFTVASNNTAIADTGKSNNAGGSFKFVIVAKTPGTTTVEVHPENDPQSAQTIYVYVFPRSAAAACAGSYFGPLRWTTVSGQQHIPFTLNPSMTVSRLDLPGTTASFFGGVSQFPNATGPFSCSPNGGDGTINGTSSTGIAGFPNVSVLYKIKITNPNPITIPNGGNAASPRRQAFSAVDADILMTLGDGIFPGEPLVMRGTGRLTGGPLCSYQFSPAALNPNSGPGQKLVTLLPSDPACAWTLSSNNPWATFPGVKSGTGSGTFTVAWTANPGPARNALITAGSQTLRIDQTATAANKPEILGVVSDGSFTSGYTPSGWVAILGSNLARTTRTWSGSDFNGTRLPDTLDGVEVTFNGRRAYPYFISPGQLNVLAPDDTTLGEVDVVVKNAGGASEPFTVSARVEVSPALFTLGPGYPAATDATGTFIGPDKLIPGAATVAAKPGQPVTLYGTGFGETAPPSPANFLVTGAPRTTSPVTARIGPEDAPVLFAGKIASGLYQINLLVPSLPNGEHDIVLSVRGAPTSQRLKLRVEK